MIHKTNPQLFSIHSNKKLIEILASKAVKRSTDSKTLSNEVFFSLVSPKFGEQEINMAEEECLVHLSIGI